MVIDASVAFKLVVEEPDSEIAIDWLARAELTGPTLLHAEVSNALWKRVRRNELAGGGELEDRLADLARYVRTIDETPQLPRALALAIELDHPVYDCVYLALAEAYDEELLTADSRFVRRLQNTAYFGRVKELGND